MDVGVMRFDVYWVDLNPTVGTEINKIRPCVIVSPDVLNKTLDTAIIAPLTTTIRKYPSRINCTVAGKLSQVCLDQIRAVDQKRLLKKMAVIDSSTQVEVSEVLVEMFVL
ncbi:type II toxin-antitoxin system PemK/MazF family toxin [Sphingobacterium paludis]|uniref:mRNA interferase n=1 Tax=Sphingobacterium paludis TaxID=1476465 RepID=A0A4R7CS14_9SPHI|nr:type II toxin-antitoxin system PemK/MazF family toxin [Sphingobacterium paludis]TDS10351.1 transcriptional modulator of MazE/toxin MazF [Sphingobacterium paludis]